MDKKQLNTVLTGLCTGRALAMESLGSITDDDYLEEDDRTSLIEDGEYDLKFIQDAIEIIEQELKEAN